MQGEIISDQSHEPNLTGDQEGGDFLLTIQNNTRTQNIWPQPYITYNIYDDQIYEVGTQHPGRQMRHFSLLQVPKSVFVP